MSSPHYLHIGKADGSVSVMGETVSMAREIIYLVGPSLETHGGIGYAIGTYCNSPLASQYRLIHISTHCEGNRLTKAWAFAKGMVRFLFLKLTLGGRLVHLHSGYGASLLRKLMFNVVARSAGCHTIFHIHGGDFDKYYERSSMVVKRIIEYFLRNVDAIVVLSNSLEKEIAALSSMRVPIYVVGNPIDVRKYKPVHRSNGQCGTHRLLFLGSITKAKGVYDIMESVQHLVAQGLKVHVTLAGDREIEQAKQRAKEISAQDIIELPGWVSESRKLEFLSNADLLLLPSYTEGMPLCVLEAMACGLPIVCTDVGGLADLVAHGENGFVVKPGDVESLTRYTRCLLGDEALRRRMGLNNVAKIAHNYSADIIVGKLSRIYGQLINNV